MKVFIKFMQIFHNKTIKAASWYTISNFVSKALLFLMTPIYTSVLSVSEYGVYNNYLSWQSLLVVLLTFDLSATVNNAYIDYKGKKFDEYISSIAFFSIVIPLIACVFILMNMAYFLNLFNLPREYVLLLCVVILFSSALNIYQSEQRVKVEYKTSSVLTLGMASISVLLTAGLLYFMDNKLTAVLMGVACVSIAVNILLYIRIFFRDRNIEWSYIKYSLLIALPLLPHVLSGTIVGSSDKIMIMKFCGSQATALYSLVFVISMVITMLASSINQAWVPWFFEKMMINQYEEIKKATKFYAAIIISGALFVSLVAPEILQIIGGKAYMEAIYLVPPIILKCILMFLYTLYVNIEFFLKRTGIISIATVFATVITVLLNYYCIQCFGYASAAYVAVIASVLQLLFHVFCVKKLDMLKVFDNKFLFKIGIGASVICSLIMLLYKWCVIRYMILIVVVGVGYYFIKRNNIIIDNQIN